ncbi:S24 family peptidase [Spirosoma aerolatum]|uniref:S24 family peptidase n=1 Tax=Spirosoma aerolatum TaxID=1211326 RepID=UPI0012D3327C|nr:S24 family peptidase [Spirosoma aerolatum]
MTEIILEKDKNDLPISEKSLRLIELRQSLDLEVPQMAARLEMNDSNYRKLENGKRPIGKHLSKLIVESFDLSKIWFETGQGEMFAPKGEVELEFIDDDEYESAILPYYPIPLEGNFNEMSDPESNYGKAEKIKVIIRRGENVERNVVFQVRGQSMYPKYSEGTKVRCKLVNPADWEYLSSGVYAISYNDSFVVKRVKDNDLLTRGLLVLHSDNSDYGSTPVPIDQIHHIWRVIRIVDSPAD